MGLSAPDRKRLIGIPGDRGEQVAYPAMRNDWFFTIGITHIPTGEEVAFEGWVNEFSDTYTQQWNEEQVYGRMDPLSTYQGTTRQIQLGFDIVNDSKSNAKANMDNIAKFLKFQYPVYDERGEPGVNQQTIIKGAPLLAIRWTNLVSSPNNADQKLVGYINGSVSYAPDLADGGFMTDAIVTHEPDPANNERQIRNYIPKKVSLSFSFTVLHTHLVGWSQPEILQTLGIKRYVFGGTDRFEGFPNVYTEFPPPENVRNARAAEAQRALDTAEGLQEADREFEDEDNLEGLNPASTEAATRREEINQHINERQQAIDERQAALTARITGRLRTQSGARNYRRGTGAGAAALREVFGE